MASGKGVLGTLVSCRRRERSDWQQKLWSLKLHNWDSRGQSWSWDSAFLNSIWNWGICLPLGPAGLFWVCWAFYACNMIRACLGLCEGWLLMFLRLFCAKHLPCKRRESKLPLYSLFDCREQESGSQASAKIYCLKETHFGFSSTWQFKEEKLHWEKERKIDPSREEGQVLGIFSCGAKSLGCGSASGLMDVQSWSVVCCRL